MMDRSCPPGSADVHVGSHFELMAHAPRIYAARKAVVEDVCCSGAGLAAGSLMPLQGITRGRRSAARLRVLLHGAWMPRARSEVRCGWGLAMG